MRIVVTGAAGFLGTHILRRLVVDGHTVTAFDQHPISDSDVRPLTGDLRDPEAVQAAVSGQETVCHVGAIGDVYLAGEDPALAAAVNVTGSANVAAAAARQEARVVFASTWEVYGQPVYEPIDEEHPCRPDHPYSITKLAGEQILLAADRLHGISVLPLRLGTAYGTGLRANSVFRVFIDRARRAEPIQVQGGGAQGRQFTHASDIARAFSLGCVSDLRGMALNVVGPDTVSIKELAEMVVTRYPTELTFGPARSGDVAPALVSAARAKELLGWQPTVSFEQGLAELMDGG
ncbi:GDP-mannose 4,6-dehydratase [soil metagenome]